MGLLQQRGMLLFQFAGDVAEWSRLGLGEIGSASFSLGRGVTGGSKDALFISQGSIACVRRVTLNLVNLRLTATTGSVRRRLCECRSAREYAEQEHYLFHGRASHLEKARENPLTRTGLKLLQSE